MKKRYCQGAFLWVLDVMSGGREDSIGGSSCARASRRTVAGVPTCPEGDGELSRLSRLSRSCMSLCSVEMVLDVRCLLAAVSNGPM
jgi:hypothetical protein